MKEQMKMNFSPTTPLPVGSYLPRTISGEFRPAPGFFVEKPRLTELENGLELVGACFRRPAYDFSAVAGPLEASSVSLTPSQLTITQVEGSIQFFLRLEGLPQTTELNVEMIKFRNKILGARVDDGSKLLYQEIFPEIEN